MNEKFYSNLIQNLPSGYGFHKIIVDENNIPVDYIFLDVNPTFELYTGLKRKDIIGKSVIEVIPQIIEGTFDWIQFYGDIALNGGTKTFTQFSEPLNKTYKIKVFSPEENYFITFFSDYSEEQETIQVFDKVIKNAPVPIMIHAEDGEVMQISDTWTTLTGYTPDDISTIADWANKAYGLKQEEIVSFIEQLYNLKSSQHDGEFLVKTKSGEQQLWDFHSTYIGKLPDSRKLAMSVALDITEKNKLEETLSSERTLFELTLLSVGDGVITTDAKGHITLLNNVAEELTGWKSTDAIGKRIEEIFQIYNELTGKKCENIVEKVIRQGKRQELANSTILLSKDGTKRPIADSAAPIILHNGDVIGCVLVFRDYTEKYQEQRKRQQLVEELKDMQILLQSSLESTKDILIISLDRDYKYLYFNKTHQNDMVSAYNTQINVGDCIFDHMTNKNDIERIKANYDKALSGTAHTTLEKYGDKVVSYYETKFNPIHNLQGKIIGLTVFAENVTKRIDMEKTIISNEKRYRGLIDNLKEGVVVHAPDTKIISCNLKASEMLGISIDELTGKFSNNLDFNFVCENLDKMKVKDYPVNLIKSNNSPIKDQILGIQQKDENNLLWVQVNGIPVLSTDGTLEEIVISFKDITYERLHQEQLEFAAHNDYLTGLFNRRYYEETLEILDIEENYPLTIVMADINGLKLINDAFGHATGDKLLVSAANLLQEYCRPTDILARIGGDEFVILMPKTNESVAGEFISNLKQKSSKIETESIPLSISFGYSSKTMSIEDIQEVYRSAEDLMYREKLLEIPSMRSSAIETILNTLYEKDPKSETHSRTVSILSEEIAKAAGLSIQDVSEVKTAGLLHDIGKIIISSSIINKTGLLTSDEYTTMKNHSEIGFRILNSTQDMRSISNIVLNHHERWDGKGYPRGIKKEEIPYKSRIISIADAFDAMTSLRNYRASISKEEALQEIIDHAGTQFDPELVKIFETNFDKIIRIDL
jgi:diguanylate cyclase (GGDEF)-like protein/PAS domain S-box-containing protein/putative nucleotidyltransferase with HDIG domain